MFTKEDLYKAYYDCRKHKRGTYNALAFEINQEEALDKLYNELKNGTYEIGRSICFVVEKPKPREVFAADFRDRVVHHLVIRKIESYLENNFIDDTYNCRVGKGVLYGVKRLEKKIPAAVDYYCSRGWKPEDIYVAKFDCKGFFMSIDREMLSIKLTSFLEAVYDKPDKEDVIRTLRKIVMHDPTTNCIRVSLPQKWDMLSADKSLFTCGKGKGLPDRQPFKSGACQLLYDGVRQQMAAKVQRVLR